MASIQGCDVLVVDALHHRSHPTHMNVTEALEVIEQAQPKLAYFTHCSHEIDHAQLEKTLPASVRIAYDTLTIDL
jgi:phosphoribosyl 1,2-cyclic phosphate phosphodiesterase